ARRDGREVEEHVIHPLGDPERFPDAAALGAKFRALARRALPDAQVERLAAGGAALPGGPGVADLLDAAVPAPQSASRPPRGIGCPAAGLPRAGPAGRGARPGSRCLAPRRPAAPRARA